MTRKFLIWISFASIYLFWGTTYLAIAIGLQTIPPFVLMGFRSLAGGLVLVAMCAGEICRASRRTWLNAAVCGALFFVGCHGVLAFAQQTVSSGLAAIALATIPLWILLLDFLSSKNRPSHYSLLAVVPGFAGVAIVAWQNISSGRAGPVAIAALLLASLSWAIGTVVSRSASDGVSTTFASGMQLCVGGLVLFAIAFCTGEMRGFTVSAVSDRSLEAAIYLTVSGSVIGFTAYHWLLRNVPTPLVATYTFVNPVVAVILGVALLGEPLSAAMIAGAALVVVSVAAMWGAENLLHRSVQPHLSLDGRTPKKERGSNLRWSPSTVGALPGMCPNRSCGPDPSGFPRDQAPGGISSCRRARRDR